MNRILNTRHMTIAAVMTSIVIIVLSVFSISRYSFSTQEKIPIRHDQWYTNSIDTLAGGRFGYSSLFAAIEKKYKATIGLLPWYPDERHEGTSASDYMLIINAPERMWNKTEATALESFLSRGGNVLIVTPTNYHLNNTSVFLKILGAYYIPTSSETESELAAHLRPYVQIVCTDIHSPLSGAALRGLVWLREGTSSGNPVFYSDIFHPWYVNSRGNPVIFYVQKKNWKNGCIIWINAALPGFNGEMKDPVFPKSASDKFIDKHNIDIPKLKKAKKEIEKAIIESRGIAGSAIPNQGDSVKIRSGISFIESILDFSLERNQQIIFFEYLRSIDDSTETLSLLSSGAFYVIVLAFLLVFTGLILFVREHRHVDLLREIRINRAIDEIPIPEIDPPVTRQAKVRFAAQFIHIETHLKKISKERSHASKK
jgi:hypothetical protein